MTGTTDVETIVETDKGSVSGLVALEDQLHAAINDAWEAWAGFRLGPALPPSAPAQPTPPESDRLVRIGYGLHDSISKIRELATDIRARS